MIEDDNIKVEMYQEREEKIAAFLKEGREFQATMDVKVAELERYKCNEDDTIDIVNMLLCEREHNKVSENNKTNPNLKRDNTHVIVSPLKKSRQTEENSGLMQTK